MKNQIPQLKLDQKILFWFAGTEEILTVREAGKYVAKWCHGMWDWQGVREWEGKSGLKKAANKWLRENNVSLGKAVVLEFQYDYDEKNCQQLSRYVAAWK